MRNNKGEVVIEIVMVSIFLILCSVVIASIFITPKTEARLFNEKFGTHYTAQDFLLAGDAIKSHLTSGVVNTSNLNLTIH